MPLTLTDGEREALEQEVARSRQVRRWRRCQAILRLSAGESAAAIARTFGVGESTVLSWDLKWRRAGLAGLRERPHPGAPRHIHSSVETQLHTWLARSPLEDGFTATNWTIALLGAALARSGTVVSTSTLRRTLKRLGYRWKRPKYVLDRPDPAAAEKKGAL